MKSILITVDVEDWFQVENFKKQIPFSSWDCRELRVEKTTHRLLELFDSASLQNPHPPDDNPHRKKLRATFFVLGWLAERLPGLVREIQARGHEVASHGYCHNLCNTESKKDLKKDLIKSRELLEDIIGKPVIGYRAPSFSVTNDVLKIVEDCGYQYDSSYNSFGMHGRYGKLSINGCPRKGIAFQLSKNFHELPISNLILFSPQNHATDSTGSIRTSRRLHRTTNNPQQTASNTPQQTTSNKQPFILPFGGGGYFRLMPFPLFKLGTNQILSKDAAYVFYMHPWEIDVKQPKVNAISMLHKYRHYTNIGQTEKKLIELIKNYKKCQYITCRDYLETQMPKN